MLSKPKYGWSVLEIDTFKSNFSYTTDVPNDLLNNIIYSLNNYNCPIAIDFDAEGYGFLLVINRYETHIILIGNDYKYFTFEISQSEVFKNIFYDIKKNVNDWANWECEIDKVQIRQNKKELIRKLKIIKNKLNI